MKMANLPVPSVSDRRDKLSRMSVTDGTGRRLLKHDGQTGRKRKEAKMHRREWRKSETNYDMQRGPLR